METEVKWLTIKYPVLEAEMARRGIKKKAMYAQLGISGRSLYNKLTGAVPFTWPEACAIQTTFFPDVAKDKLFSTGADISSPVQMN